MRPLKHAVVRIKTRALWDPLDLLSRSRNWLAQEIGISPSYLSKLVGEERAPSGRIRDALGVRDFKEMFAMERESDNA